MPPPQSSRQSRMTMARESVMYAFTVAASTTRAQHSKLRSQRLHRFEVRCGTKRRETDQRDCKRDCKQAVLGAGNGTIQLFCAVDRNPISECSTELSAALLFRYRCTVDRHSVPAAFSSQVGIFLTILSQHDECSQNWSPKTTRKLLGLTSNIHQYTINITFTDFDATSMLIRVTFWHESAPVSFFYCCTSIGLYDKDDSPPSEEECVHEPAPGHVEITRSGM
ncbi:uncharacterized protein MEPE_03501 [Melanopsichium pennsylvanicum]|uniref:Uncharacterized protein n=1 Tax=Melanopsichium pennsylvanicum TaxID=63383 RepID=A0AAJ4XMY1_9BASI|nr:uncharacterized protein MEPE_03501 [Melanopsichium pennsylvanicum]